MGFLSSLFGKPKMPAFDAALDPATKARLRAEADKTLKPIDQYQDTTRVVSSGFRGGDGGMGTGTTQTFGDTAEAQRTRDLNAKYKELATNELSKPATTTAPPTIQEAEQISRNRLTPSSSRQDNRRISMEQVAAGLARRQSAQAPGRINR